MRKRLKLIVLLIVLSLLLAIGAFAAVPRVVGGLPGEYRVRLARIPLMKPLLEIGITPLPTALPAPSIAAALPKITIPVLAPSSATPKSRETATEIPDLAGDATESALPTTAPTSTPHCRRLQRRHFHCLNKRA